MNHEQTPAAHFCPNTPGVIAAHDPSAYRLVGSTHVKVEGATEAPKATAPYVAVDYAPMASVPAGDQTACTNHHLT